MLIIRSEFCLDSLNRREKEPSRRFMKRKSEKTMVDVRDGVSLVHLNVGSGYLTYIDEDDEKKPQVRNVVLKGSSTEES